MTVAEAIELFLQAAAPDHSVSNRQYLILLSDCFSPNKPLPEITSANVRDFLSRFCVEQSTSITDASIVPSEIESPATSSVTTNEDDGGGLRRKTQQLLDSLAAFFEWTDRRTASNQSEQFLPIIAEMRDSLPRTLEISRALTNSIRKRGGAFTFPEFLTSFEEGGSSQYDIDVPGSVGAIDGYFRIIRVEGSLVEAEELISEERVWPIRFPTEVAEELNEGYIINLELVYDKEVWEIVGCGFAYPPKTEL